MSNEVIKQISFLIYDEVQVKAVLKDESIWLSQKGMAELFECSSDNISLHLKNIFESGELDKNSVTEKISVTANDGKNYLTNFYNLDAIISVGYRINSAKATKFRIWATNVLKEFIKKGFVLDDERLKQGQNIFGKDYFTELLERVRSIRASERRIWQKITDIFAECAFDYDKNSELTKSFFATIQNKFHYAITGQTAPEIIFSRADANIQNMGLMTWKNSPNGRILKSDTIIAKNYLNEKQIKQLERAVSGYFDYIEDLIEREIAFDMQSFIASVNEFLAFRKYDILEGKGSVSRKTAESKAFSEYNEFNKTQKINSDFDVFIKNLKS
ncbi:virulence RhuM family protein [Campylobacter sp.]|uniref:virulence RhuM family protein n=1 Tax=Campylobacter sp. TaxID=205 RepID=UPI0025BB2AD2|nr:virulence RhuM family protein [Campylobacter sp.]